MIDLLKIRECIDRGELKVTVEEDRVGYGTYIYLCDVQNGTRVIIGEVENKILNKGNIDCAWR